MSDNTQNYLKFAIAIAIVGAMIIYPVLGLDVPEPIINAFGTISVFLFGLSSSLGQNNGEQ